MVQNIIIFASGSGSNAVNTCNYFANHATIKIRALFCNNPKAGVIAKMEALNIPVILFNRADFNNENWIENKLQGFEPSLICLLGFLWKIPAHLVQAYPHKILNLHPALLPKFGGKGMYGQFVHEAVKAANETESGITLHWVNEHYDEGGIIAQFKFRIEPNDSAQNIGEKVHALEQEQVPKVIEKVLEEISAQH
jgi:phosphoribosylglycinamide formyltransferase-1